MLRYWSIFFCIYSSVVMAVTHHPQEFLNKIATSNEEGIKIVKHFCVHCHAEQPVIPLGAPRCQQLKDWEPRLKDLKLLFQHTNEGFNAMPPRGGCFECTDLQLILAIVAMLPKELAGDSEKSLKKLVSS